jgi:hypothetical protein
MFAVLGTTLLMGSALAIDVARMFATHNKLDVSPSMRRRSPPPRDLTLGDIRSPMPKRRCANISTPISTIAT